MRGRVILFLNNFLHFHTLKKNVFYNQKTKWMLKQCFSSKLGSSFKNQSSYFRMDETLTKKKPIEGKFFKIKKQKWRFIYRLSQEGGFWKFESTRFNWALFRVCFPGELDGVWPLLTTSAFDNLARFPTAFFPPLTHAGTNVSEFMCLLPPTNHFLALFH